MAGGTHVPNGSNMVACLSIIMKTLVCVLGNVAMFFFQHCVSCRGALVNGFRHLTGYMHMLPVI